MQSSTKVEVSRDQLQAAVTAAFGASVTLVGSQEFTDGWFNTIHGLELSDGRRIALKLAPKVGVPTLRYEADLLSTEVAVYRLLAKVEGVRVPQVWFHETTGDVLGLPFFVMDWINAPTYAKVKGQLSDDERATIERHLGAMNRRLNAVIGPAFGALREAGFRSSRWSEVVLHLVAEVLADGRDKKTALPWPEDRILALIEGHRSILDQVREPRLVHWDLHDGNAFVEGTTVQAIIDSDRALWGDPLMEVYFSALLGGENFIEGYGPGVADAPGALVRRAVYDVYLGLVMVVECDFRGFSDEHRAWTVGNLIKALEACEVAR